MSEDTPLLFNWSWQFNATPEIVWPLVSDTRKINEASGVFENFTYDFIPDSDLSSIRQTQKGKQFINTNFVEHPFEWVRPSWFQVRRDFEGGPMVELFYKVTLTANDKGTKLQYDVTVKPRRQLYRKILNYYISHITYAGLDRAYKGVAAYLRGITKKKYPDHPNKISPELNETLLVQRVQQIQEDGADAQFCKAIDQTVRYWAEAQLSEIKPYGWADEFALNRKKALSFLLLCTRAGILDLHWRPYCPSCHGSANVKNNDLESFDNEAYCPACNLTYETLFDKGIEATFSPNSSIRKVLARVYCTGGPEQTGHIWLQKIVPALELYEVDLELHQGVYKILGPRGNELCFIEVEENGGEIINCEVNEDNPSPPRYITGQCVRLEVRNNMDTKKLIKVHQAVNLTEIATASEVTSLKEFRQYFNNMLIRQGEQLSVSNIVILFTDLRSSTQMYRDLGDAKAVGLIQKHFDIVRDEIANNGGYVIKTIGDAVMAVFHRPEEAFKASGRIISEFEAFNQKENATLCIKLGLHSGSAFALTYNKQIDYFGSTINFCSRLEKLTDKADLVVTDIILKNENVRKMFGWCSIQSFSTPIRGISEAPVNLHRITFKTNGWA
ncbi:MAG: DUF5939 domain-containing protein [Balneolales bacterium]